MVHDDPRTFFSLGGLLPLSKYYYKEKILESLIFQEFVF
jgi:hypothetical protein